MQKEKVLVAMSGGVDSSAVCLMLQEQGYDVIGMTMRVWDIPHQFSPGEDLPNFIVRAQKLAERLGIEHHIADVREEFRKIVVQDFLDEYIAGRTPNPCVLCNRKFKFRLLADLAEKYDCKYIATGHYVKTEEYNGHTYLLMGDDIRKDQSYFLWRVPQSTLQRCIFPLGKMEKPAVRQYLADKGFTFTSQLSESMEICFVENDYRTFLKEQCPELEAKVAGGSYVDTTGRKIGEHTGVPFYTIGQRKGLGIALGKPAYVVRLNPDKNTIVLGEEEDLQTTAFFADTAQIIDNEEFFSSPDLSVRIRYHSQPVKCKAEMLEDGRLLIHTGQEVSAVTPGQSAVFYIGKRMVAGAVICSQRGIGVYLAQD